MLNLKGKQVYLRALEPEDLQFLYELENDTAIWEISGTSTPYSKHVLQLYLDNAHRDIYDVKQLRLCICNLEDQLVGLIDQIFANVAEDNAASVHLFKKLGFEQVGVKNDWILLNGTYKNEILFQKINL